MNVRLQRFVVALGLVATTACAGTKPRPPAKSPAPEASNEDEEEESSEGPRSGETGECAVERWDVKIGTDTTAQQVDLAHPRPTSIQKLRGLPVPGRVGLHTPRFGAEQVVYELKNVRLVCFKHESGPKGDGDFHLVVQDPAVPAVSSSDDPKCAGLNPRTHDIEPLNTMIVEIPDPQCLHGRNPWAASISAVRKVFIDRMSPAPTPRRVDEIVSLRGVAFFDVLHGQLGVAPNGIELHPVFDLCFGQDCLQAIR